MVDLHLLLGVLPGVRLEVHQEVHQEARQEVRREVRRVVRLCQACPFQDLQEARQDRPSELQEQQPGVPYHSW